MDAVRLFKATREYLTPVLQKSAFIERGMLTPEEFVVAGDQLVRICPTWSWSKSEPNKLRPYLPEDKQFLITKRVPSYRRVSDMNANVVNENIMENDLGAANPIGEWCAPQILSDSEQSKEVYLNATQHIDRSLELTDEQPPEVTSTSFQINTNIIDENHFGNENLHIETTSNNTTNTKEPPFNTTPPVSSKNDTLSDLVDNSLLLDDASMLATTAGGADGKLSYIRAAAPVEDEENCTLVARRYDISITYDNYYRTPRIWLYGHDENGVPLSPEAMFQDIMTDYVNRTVTLDPHPHLSHQHASIHPCRHGPAMKRIIDALMASGKVPTVDQYLFIFLKFIQSVIPTIEYDYTTDVQVGSSRS